MHIPFTHRISVRDESNTPTLDADSMMAEGFVYSPDRPSHVSVEVAPHLLARVDAQSLWRRLIMLGAHPGSFLTVRAKPGQLPPFPFAKEVLSL